MGHLRWILLTIALTLAVGAAWGQPVIVAVSGGLARGERLVINGQGFGTREVAWPVLFDDFQGGNAGEALAPTPEAPWLVADDMGSLYLPRYSMIRQRTGDDMTCLQSFGPRGGAFQNNCRLGVDDARLARVYFSGWLLWENRAASTAALPLSVRLFEHGGSQERGLGCWRAYPRSGVQVGALTSLPCPAGDLQLTKHGYGLPEEGSWHRVEIWRSFGADRDAETFNLRVDGQDRILWAGNGPGCDLSTVTLVSWFGDPDERAAMDFYWSEVYLDDTRARVELGDAPRFEDCGHRELQIPEAWSDGQLTIRVRLGTFVEGDPVYLFVVDEQGRASGGCPVVEDPGSQGVSVVGGSSSQD